MRHKAVFVAAALWLSACAGSSGDDAASSAYQQLSVSTPGHAGAHCFIQSGKRHYTLSTPARVNVARSTQPLDVTCFSGEHMVGKLKVLPHVAPAEARAGDDCRSCRYPDILTVAMGLNPRSFDVNLVEIK